MSVDNKSGIELCGLELTVNLGWPDAERAQPQTILLDVAIHFATPPDACISDNLADTYCYENMVNQIKKTMQSKSFRLLEHIGHEIYQTIKVSLPATNTLTIKIKKHPPIPQLTGGVTFYFGDRQPAW